MSRGNVNIDFKNIHFFCEKIVLRNRNKDGEETDIRNIYGVLEGANIYGLELTDEQLIYFISVLESFLKNQLSGIEDEYFKIVNTKGKTLISIYLEEQRRITLNKLQCNYILNCYRAATREYTLVSSSKWTGIE